jgi:hypothetical protein
VATVEERKMKRRRDITMTPPPESLCYFMLMTTICFVLATAQTSDLEQPSADAVYTDTTLETGRYRNRERCVLTHAASVYMNNIV